MVHEGFPISSAGEESACNAETWVQSLGWQDPLEKGNSHPLHYSCLENSLDRGAGQATVYDVAKSQTRLSDFHFTDAWKEFPSRNTERVCK